MIQPIDTTFKAPESSKALILGEYEVLRLIAEKLNELIELVNKSGLPKQLVKNREE